MDDHHKTTWAILDSPFPTPYPILAMLRLTDLREILRYVPQFRDRTFVIAMDGAVVECENFGNLLLDIALLLSPVHPGRAGSRRWPSDSPDGPGIRHHAFQY